MLSSVFVEKAKATCPIRQTKEWHENSVGKVGSINRFLRADHGWGKLFQSYPLGKPRKYPEIQEWDPY